MASSGWRSGTTLAAALGDCGSRFGFYQAVRLLSRLGREQQHYHSSTPDAQLLGRIEFTSDAGDAFTGGDIRSIEFVDDKGAARIKTNNWGIAGPRGPLPQPYGQWLLENSASGDHAMEAFLDMFNHQISALRYLIRSRSHLNLNEAPAAESHWSVYLAALQGLSGSLFKNLPDRNLPPAHLLLAYSGLLADERVSMPRVCNTLSALLQLPVRLNNFRGEWLRVPEDDRAHLTHRRGTRLDGNGVLGASVWQQHAGIELHIQPPDWDSFTSLLPLGISGSRFEAFRALALYVTSRRWTIALCLQVNPQCIQPTRLAYGPQDSHAGHLGYTSWLSGKAARPGRPVTITIRPEA